MSRGNLEKVLKISNLHFMQLLRKIVYDIHNKMNVKLEQCPLQKDIEVKIKYSEKNKIVESIVSFLNSIDSKIECFIEQNLKQVNISDIYYIESFEKKTLVYSEKECHHTKYRLYQLNEKLIGCGFIKISKYCILNVNKIDRVKPLFNSRMEVILTNGVRLYVTRKYLAGIKQKLREDV